MKRLAIFLTSAAWTALAIAAPAATAPAGGAGGPPATTPPAAPQAPAPLLPPGQSAHTARGVQKTEAVPAAAPKFTFEKPDDISCKNFPEVELKTPNLATYIGLQFGTGKQDIAYICFDTENAQKVHDRAFWYVASSTNKPVMEHGRGEAVQQNRNVKVGTKEKPQRFDFPILRAKIGDADVLYKITCVMGHEARANCHMTAEVAYKQGKSQCSFMLHGNLSDTGRIRNTAANAIPTSISGW